MPSAPYIELHAHSAFSFLDGASTPAELAAAAAIHGYPAFALTDHDGVWGSMEFAVACGECGVRPIAGAELTLEGRRPPDSAGREPGRLPQPLPAADRGALPHPRGRAAPRRAARGGAGAGRGPRRGARLPLGLRPRRPAGGRLGARRGGERGAAGPPAAGGIRPRQPPGRAAASLLAPRPRPQPPARPARRPARRALRRDRQRPLPRPSPRRPPGRLRRGPAGDDPGGLRAGTPRQLELGAQLSRGGWRRASPSTPRRSPRPCASPSGCAST